MIELTEKEIWYWLCNLPGIGYKKITNLLSYYGDANSIAEAKRSEAELQQIEHLNRKDIALLKNALNVNAIHNSYEKLKEKNIRFYSIEEEEYPKKLKMIYDPPYGIYVTGTLPKNEQLSIGIVGARNCSNYGKEVGLAFSSYLAKMGVQIISGMARGVDSYGHEGALRGNGYTLAVLGCGIDVCYPGENIGLYHKLQQEGAILSEYGLGVKPLAGNFPRRNRIISALCDGLLVVEAKDKSGSLITVDQALEQGKDVFSIPGRIGDVLSGGTNHLIQMGAQLVTHPEELLEYYKTRYPLIGSGKKEEGSNAQDKLTSVEKIIISQLGLELLHINDIVVRTKLNLGVVMDGLLSLEIKGFIKQPFKNYYTKNGLYTVTP